MIAEKSHYWNTGEFYHGQWLNNKIHGFGIYISAVTVIYGQFSQGLLHGYCLIEKKESSQIMKFINGEAQKAVKSMKGGITNYIGSNELLKDMDKRYFITLLKSQLQFWSSFPEGVCYSSNNGYGLMVHADGRLEFGQFANYKLNGTGSILFESGDRYSGQLYCGKLQGEGIFYNAQSKIYSLSRFKNNQMVEIIKQSDTPILNKVSGGSPLIPQLSTDVRVLTDILHIPQIESPSKNTSMIQSSRSKSPIKASDFQTHFTEESPSPPKVQKRDVNYYTKIHGRFSSMKLDRDEKSQILSQFDETNDSIKKSARAFKY